MINKINFKQAKIITGNLMLQNLALRAVKIKEKMDFVDVLILSQFSYHFFYNFSILDSFYYL
jgi:hypothetical protein